MAKFKYIIIDNGDQELPILFSKFFQHKTIANKFGNIKIVSAGFVKIEATINKLNDNVLKEVKFYCFGESVGLKIKSRPEDSELIKKDYQFEV